MHSSLMPMLVFSPTSFEDPTKKALYPAYYQIRNSNANRKGCLPDTRYDYNWFYGFYRRQYITQLPAFVRAALLHPAAIAKQTRSKCEAGPTLLRSKP